MGRFLERLAAAGFISIHVEAHAILITKFNYSHRWLSAVLREHAAAVAQMWGDRLGIGRLARSPVVEFMLPSPPTGRNRCRLLRGRFPGSSRSSRNSAKTSRLKRVQVSRPAVEPADRRAVGGSACAGANPARRSAALARASRTATRRAEGRRAILLL